jgi:hypothetical protein
VLFLSLALDTNSLSLANFVGFVVGFVNVCTIRLVAFSLPPRYPLKAKWDDKNFSRRWSIGKMVLHVKGIKILISNYFSLLILTLQKRFILIKVKKNIQGDFFNEDCGITTI